MMLFSVLAVTAFAADKITITVDVYDISTNTIYRNVGTDTVNKGTFGIESENYRIPELSKFTNVSYGRVQEVTGNWWRAPGSANVGTNVVFSNNNSNARITYWVSYYGNGSSGGGSSGSGSESSGSGKYSMSYTIVYHSNYPGGPDYIQTYSYTIYDGHRLTGRAVDVKSPADLGFSAPAGYKLKSTPWNNAANGSGAGVNTKLYVTPNSVNHIYAQWEEYSIDPDTRYTVTYMDGDTKLADHAVVKGEKETTLVLEDSGSKTFKGWSLTDGGAVVYGGNVEFTPTGNITLYAVWEENSSSSESSSSESSSSESSSSESSSSESSSSESSSSESSSSGESSAPSQSSQSSVPVIVVDGSNTGSGDKDVPNTGDSFVLPAAFVLLSGAVVAVVLSGKKKSK